MKTHLIKTCLLVAMRLAQPAVTQAQFNYITTNGAITITGYIGTNSAVNIPAAINGLPVTSIGDGAFQLHPIPTSVTIPNSVSNIGGYAFSGCYNLTTIAIPNGVNSIGDFAFWGCGLAVITIPNSVTSIGEGAFNACDGLTNITANESNTIYSSVNGVLFNKNQTMLVEYPSGMGGSYMIPNSVSCIGENAFGDARGLTIVTIPNSLTSIGGSAFSGCSGLTTITIPNSVISIGDQAFWGCGLSSIMIPNSVTNLGAGAFDLCFSMTNIAVAGGNPIYSSLNGVLFDKSQTTLIEFPVGIGGSYTIPDGVTNIGGAAFWYCGGLTSITIPDSVTNIGNGAFWGCYNLTSMYFKGNAPSTGESIFFNGYYYSLETVYYLVGTTGWGDTFAGRPTALWLPQAQTSDGSFGVKNNHFGFNIIWASGQTVVVEATSDLAIPVWIPVATNVLTSGTSYFTDPQSANLPARFYRLTTP